MDGLRRKNGVPLHWKENGKRQAIHTFGEIAGTLAFMARNLALPSVSFAGTLVTGTQMGGNCPPATAAATGA
jgi:hypothetical protein